MKTLRTASIRLLALALSFGVSLSTAAATRPVWQIGTVNHSPYDFNIESGGDPLFGARFPKVDPVYIVGKSTPATDWPAYQWASTIAGPDSHLHPYAIEFDLKNAPAGVFVLKLGLISQTATTAVMQVDINGHKGLFYQHPKLSYAGGDRDMVTLPRGGEDTITVDFPAQFLHQGSNRITLTAIDQPMNKADKTRSIVAYDAIELDNDAEGSFAPNAITTEVEPTIYYHRQGTGSGAGSENGLAEEVTVYLRSNAAIDHGQLTLTVGKNQFNQPLIASEFGEQRLDFMVPEFPASTSGSVLVKAGTIVQKNLVLLNPAKKWNLLVVPHIHIDVGYSDYQEKVAEIQSRVLDEAMQMVRDHPDFRFSTDGYWSVRQYMAGRTEERQQQLFQMVKDKKIFVPTMEASLLTGFSSPETLIRSLYPGYAFNQKHGGDADYANLTDVPNASWSYASILASAGLKYFFVGCDNDNGPFLLSSRMNERSPFWWEGPDGSRILTWYSWVYAQLDLMFSNHELSSGHEALPIFLQQYEHPEYKSDAVILYGSQWENTDLDPRQASLAGEWNQLYAYPHMQYSGFSDAMQTIAMSFGDSIPVVRGDSGPYWEDGIASTARAAAIDRASEQRVLAAEEFSTISSLVNPGTRADREELSRLWNNIVLFNEHTWGGDRSVADPKSQEATAQLAVKEAFANAAKAGVDQVLRRGMASLANSIYDPEGTLLVFNPLSWKRSSLVETDLEKGRELIDLTTRQSVPFEVLSTSNSYWHIRYLAHDVPSVGYKAYRMKSAKAAAPVPPPTIGTVMENSYYRVELDPESGSVKSIFDKGLNKELVNPSSPYRFNQYLYVTGGDQFPNSILEYSSQSPKPALVIHKAGSGRLISMVHAPFGTVARLESSGVNTPKIETEIILFDHQKKIEFTNHVQKNLVYTKEGVYFAFPFAMDHPEFRYETQNGFVNPAKDQVAGAGKEWFSVQHWIAADQNGVSAAIIPLDASLVTLGDVMRGAWPREWTPRSGTVFSQVMNNYYFTNYAAAQGGDFTFRYVLTSSSHLEAAELSRAGREEMSPLETDQITYQDKAINSKQPLNAAEGSFLQVDQPDVALITWKQAEDEKGTILRFIELAGKSANVGVETPLLNVKAAWMADALERDQNSLTTSPHGFRFAVKPFQIVTVRVQGASAIESVVVK